MRRRLAAVVVFVAVLVALRPHHNPGVAHTPTLVPLVRSSATSPLPSPDTDPVWATSASRLSEACGVDVTATCTEAGCAAVANTPDLDHLSGWVRLGWDHPGLVAATVLGDLGLVPRTALPCDSAIAAMSATGDTRVTIGDGPRGTWVACVWTSTRAADNAPCASLAAAAGLPWQVSDPTRRW